MTLSAIKTTPSVSSMASSTQPDDARPFLVWQRIADWAQEHYRCRTFNKDEKIPTRPGLLYLVQRGAVRLTGHVQISATLKQKGAAARMPLVASEEAFLGFVGAGQPFEIVAQSPFSLQSFAHVDQTTVIWLYWNDLDTWPHFRREVLDAFRKQHQRKLLWLSTLGQRRTIDRLFGFLTLLVDEFGEPCEGGYYLTFPLTHAQIGSAIGSTRVTVTRLMGKLRQRGLIQSHGENLIALPYTASLQYQQKQNPIQEA
jgi:CRP-like cAMP-binding protein